MIFPYDSNSRFSDPKAASPTQRPASNSDARKRAGEPGFSPSDVTFERELGGLDGCGSIPQATSTERGSIEDPHLDNGFAEVIRKAKAEAWDRGYTSGHSNAMRRMSDEPGAPTTPNPYRSAS